MSATASRPKEIADRLRTQILTGRYRPGERLPSERELAEQAGVNRGSAREALKLLANEGMVDAQPGGSRVAPLHHAKLEVLGHVLRMSEAPDPILVGQLLDVHELLLVGAARLAVERASDEELARALELLPELLRRDNGGEAYVGALVELLRLVARASQNLVLHMVGNSLHVVLGAVIPLLRRSRPRAATLTPSIDTIRDALLHRDPEKASKGVRSLLRIKREAILKELEQPSAKRSTGRTA
jgi:GntR family transcriptional repressor for pyruvate dehydrogenase complex